VDQIGGSQLFSSLHLRSGYNQIRIASEDTHKTCFRSQYGAYKILVVPFGLAGSPPDRQWFEREGQLPPFSDPSKSEGWWGLYSLSVYGRRERRERVSVRTIRWDVTWRALCDEAAREELALVIWQDFSDAVNWNVAFLTIKLIDAHVGGNQMASACSARAEYVSWRYHCDDTT
jgi:hypothetical protein